MRRFLAVGLVTAGLLATTAVSPALACGCGGIVGPEDSSISASSERAIISWSGGRETIDLTFDIESEGTTAGIIVPTPQPAKLSAGDPRTFDLIESVIAPTVTVEKDWWGIDYFVPDADDRPEDSLDRAPLDPIKSTTIAATDTLGLTAWLVAHEFVMSEEMATSIATYADYGWTFTLITLASDDVINGHIDPIRLSFDTNRLVYPMRFARSETTPQNVRLYVFDKQRNDVTQAAAPTLTIDADIEELYAGEVEDSRLTALGPYLSAFDITYDVPKDQVVSDIGFFESSRETDVYPVVTEYRPVTLLGLPLGTLIVVWVLIGAILVVAHVRGRRRAR